tara:strand:- start:4 stop:519 length:516 start_codon:yes stop_codon:yes gene_type:complete
MWRLFLIFVGVPLLEMYLLIRVSSKVGFLTTLFLVFVTGVLGATLAKNQGLSVMRRVQADLAAGRIPGEAMLDGIIILLAGAVLITPGILTDVFGFLCLVPQFRAIIRKTIGAYLKQGMQQGNVQFFGNQQSPWSHPYNMDPGNPHTNPFDQETSGPVIDVEVKPSEPKED